MWKFSKRHLIYGKAQRGKKNSKSNLLFGESIKMVTFLIIAQQEITVRGESGCIYSYSAPFHCKAAWSDFCVLY